MTDWLEGYARIPASRTRYSTRRGVKVRGVVVHYTATPLEAEAQAEAWTERGSSRSAHFTIGRDGTVVQCVPLDRASWHCGGSVLPSDAVWRRGVTEKGRTGSANRPTIGIELCNLGFGVPDEGYPLYLGRHRNPRSRRSAWEAYPYPQVEALEALVTKLAEAVPSLRYLCGHDDIANHQVSPKKIKVDPGPAFPWGLAAWGRLVVVRRDFELERWAVEPTNPQPPPPTNPNGWSGPMKGGNAQIGP